MITAGGIFLRNIQKPENTLPLSNVKRVKAERKEGAMITELYTVYQSFYDIAV